MTSALHLAADILIPGLLTAATARILPEGAGLRPARLAAAAILTGAAIVLEAFLPWPYERNAVFVLNVIPLCVGLTFGLRVALAGLAVAVPGIVAACGSPGAVIIAPASMLVSLFLSALCGGATGSLLGRGRPGVAVAALLAVVAEAAGGASMFLLTPSHTPAAYAAINAFLPVQMAVNAAAAAVAAAALPARGRTQSERKDGRSIAQNVQTILGCCSLAVFVGSLASLHLIQTNLAVENMQRILRTTMRDIDLDIKSFVTTGIGFPLDIVTRSLRTGPVTRQRLIRLAQRCGEDRFLISMPSVVDARPTLPDEDRLPTDNPSSLPFRFPSLAEIDVADASGIVVQSTNPGAVGLDLSRTLALPGKGETAIVPTADSGTGLRLTFAIRRLPDGRVVRIGLGNGWLTPYLQDATTNWHIGETGSALIVDDDLNIVSELKRRCTTPAAAGIDTDITGMAHGAIFRDTVFGVPSYVLHGRSEGYHLLVTIAEEEVMLKRSVAMTFSLTWGIVTLAILSGLVYALVKFFVVDNIGRVGDALARITAGDLDARISIGSGREFAALSRNINATVETLRRHIDEAAKRLDKELELARSIQRSALPGVFPPFPLRRDIDVHASMATAKEVGGDFYDFALLGEDRLLLLVADVSGKGIPAALFMMRAKTILRDYAEAGLPPEDIAARANEVLCGDNEANMFATAWIGILDTRTGETAFANAGHNPPLIRRDGEWSYQESEPGLPLAAMEGAPYAGQRVRLGPGDAIVLYTDGVTEAMDADGAAYGEGRPLALLRSIPDATAEELCRAVRDDVAAFVGDAPRSDDITLLALVYRGGRG